ncbi:sugar-binding transcriptional regulator [Vagococcus intermedius]|uniref:Sugar-binding domain-containing protein n=1 Tax=Vagococcus intermedius TaxID=2991418 RepID=A0AAF0CWB2_9ENTE|nr:sugar-binding domain-containing protein [Vagococcus intermedius]WEG74066.1 sugar-binding domain-containing protein [Vagococcus intermedius]WEG76146.1 sugar-binding domain-containing protein [Vagococcus intermedius]
MENQLELIEAIAPDLIKVVQERFTILRAIDWMAPVGRRTLAVKMGMTERVLRTETDLLKSLHLIDASKSGMTITSTGKTVLVGLESLMGHYSGMQQKERQLADYYNVERCIIVAGNSDDENKVLASFGSVVSQSLRTLLPDKENVIAVMGGTTMAAVAENMTDLDSNIRNNIFVPARGGIGETIGIQANSVSAMMASKTGGTTRPLYVPERVSHETYQSLLQEPFVQQVLGLIDESTCVIHSIGRALHMAARRGMTDVELVMLKDKGAVSESFGYFFDKDGQVVHKIPRIGLQLKDLEKIPYILAVAGGKSKAQAIDAYMKHAPKQTWLITDESAANEILKEETL